MIREYDYKDASEHGAICSLAYSNRGDLLAYGLSNGAFNILRRDENQEMANP